MIKRDEEKSRLVVEKIEKQTLFKNEELERVMELLKHRTETGVTKSEIDISL